MIPEEKQSAVKRALNEAFGVNEFEDIRSTSGGQSSALVFRIMVAGKPYLLKFMRAEIISDPAHEFACMKTAAQAGIAPWVWYANVEDRLLITNYVEAKPYPDDMALLIAPILRRLHALPDFPKPNMGNYFDAMHGFVLRYRVQHGQHADGAANLLPESDTQELFRGYDELVKIYPRRDSELVASHNDLKPQNMRYDGQRLWLVDWESAFLNDRYADLAVVANFFVKDEIQEEAYLKTYFAEPNGSSQPLWEYRRARFYLMSQAMHVFYAGFLMLLAARAGSPMAADMSPELNFREFHQRLISGEIDTLKPEAQRQYSKVHLTEALRNMRKQRFQDSLALVANFQPG